MNDRGRGKLVIAIILLAVAVIISAGVVIYQADLSLELQAKRVEASVVSIVATKQVEGLSRIFFDGPKNEDGSTDISGGTGFFVSAEGVIVTNDHILSGEDYTVVTADGEKFSAQILKQFPEQDIAFLKIEGNKWPAVRFNTGSVGRQGQRVFSLGNTLGYYSNTLHTGIIAAPQRPIEKNGVAFPDMIQLEMNIANGDSGAPLFNSHGQVIGLVTAFDNRATNLAFALPADQIVEAFNQL